MLMVHGANCTSKILKDIYLAKLMARRRISIVICYIAFMTRICNVCDKAFKPNQHIIWQLSGYGFVCKGCGQKFKTNNSFNRQKKTFGFPSLPQEEFLKLLHVVQQGRRGKGQFFPTPGRGKKSFTISIVNAVFGF